MQAFLALLPILLRTLAAAGTGLSPHLSNILGAVSSLVEQGEAAFPKFEALTNHVVDVVKGGSSPTPEQVDTLNAHIAAANTPTVPS